ncbi:DNA cytosine methyltransferase [Streptomyces diastaticus]|uniref:DNA cytosine methyltransferase n=1 Tax=Streptomyces diastaticus TaxID=1956 RepID=UPI0036A139D9
MTSTNALPMPVAEALADGAPRNLGALAATATARGWGATVERDGDAWTLVIASPADSRTGRYTWRAGKWAAAVGYRVTVGWYRSAPDAMPGTAVVEPVDVAPVVEEVAPSTNAEAAALATLRDASDKITKAVAEARDAVQEAQGCHAEAETAGEAAEAASTTREAEDWAEEAEDAAGRAPECVKRAKSALRRVQAQRRAIQVAARAVEELGLDEGYRRTAVEAEDTARELLGDAEEAAEEAQNWAEAARETAERVCPMCQCFMRRTPCGTHPGRECGACAIGQCGCRALMLATLDRAGSTVARTVDAEAVRVGYLLDSDDAARVEAGQLMLAGDWTAEDMLAEADGPAEAVTETVETAPETAPQRAAECAETAEERPSDDAGWENGRTRERARVLEGWATVAEAEDYVTRFPQCIEVRERFERYEGEWRRSALLSTVHAAGVEFGARLDFNGAGWTVSLPTGDVSGRWGDVARAVRAYVIATHPAHVVAFGEIYERQARIDARREAEYAAAEAEGMRALDAVRTDAARAAAATRALRTVDVFMPDDALEAVESAAADAARNAAECERVWRGVTAYWWEMLGKYAARVRNAAAWLIEGAAAVGVDVPDVAPVVSAAADASPSDPGAVDGWESDGGACVGVESPRGPECGPAAAEDVPTPDPRGSKGAALPQELDEDTTKARHTPAGEGAFSRELDAYASRRGGGSEGKGAAAPVAAGLRVVRRGDMVREAEAAADAAEAAAGVLAELWAEAARVADCAPLGDVRTVAAAEAAEVRWYRMDWRARDARRAAELLREEDGRNRAAVERARMAAARLLSGEVPAGRGAWLSADGGAAVTFPLAWESDDNPAAEKDGAFVALLADAVAARDEGRTLKATDVPSKVKTGRGPGAEFRAAVATSGRPLVDPWKAPRIPAEGKPLGAETLSAWDMAGDVISETEAAPGVWLPMAAVQLAETACGNGWTVAMQREDGGRTVTVRAAGTAERRGEPVAYELSAVWVDGAWCEGRSGVWVNGERYRGGAPLWRPKERGRQAPSILGTLAHPAEAGTLAPAVPPAGAVSAPAPAGVSDPGTAEAWEGEGGAVPGVAIPRPTAQLRELDANTSKGDTVPGGEGGFSRGLDEYAPKEAAEVRQARRRAEEAERRAVDARERAERLQGAASAHYERFAGGQPILMRHHSAAGALRDRARGDAATRKAMAAAEEAERAEVAARGARQAAELAETFAGRSRPWERADFRAGDVVEVRKSYTATYVVVRANAKTLTLRNAHTIDDTKARYDQVISRTRDGQTVTDPGAASAEEGDAPGGEGGISPELDAHASGKPGRCPACGCREVRGGRCDGCGWTPAPAATVDEEEHQAAEEEAAPLAAVAGHPAVAECQATAELLTAYAEEHPGDEEAEGWAFEAVERADFCTWAVEDGDEEGARALADEAKGVRAAFTLGRLDEAGPMTPERLAALDADTLALLKWYAGPWPVRWLWPPETDEAGKPLRPRVINLFHGPGGWSVGIRDVLGADVDMVGVDLDPGAVATAEAAGFEMIHASVTDLDPESPALQWVTGVILSPPCQAYSPAGLRMGRYASAIELIVSVVRCVGAAAGFLALVDEDGNDAGTAPRAGETWDEVRAPLAALDDVRAGLMAEVVVWPLAMLTRGGSVEWVAVEQSSALPSEIERALLDEFVQAGWGTVEAETLDAVDYGAASHRRRRFMTAYRTAAPFVSVRPSAPLPRTTFAECVAWERGRTVATRGKRGINPETGRAKGGGNFSADKPSTCITATAYGWADAETGEKIQQAQIGRLVGFRGDYPWRHVGRGEGIRNRAQQAADAVCPMVAAAVIGRALDVEEWETRARAYAHELYGTGTPAAVPVAPAAGASVPRPRRAPVAEPVRAMLGAAPTTATAAGTGARRNRPRPAGAAAPVRGPLSRGPQGGGRRVYPQVTAHDRARRDRARDRVPGGPCTGVGSGVPLPPLGRWAGAGAFPET